MIAKAMPNQSESRAVASRYKWLLFDADGTLFDYDRAERVALEQALTRSQVFAVA